MLSGIRATGTVSQTNAIALNVVDDKLTTSALNARGLKLQFYIVEPNVASNTG